jgi:hypothetical protein
MAPPVKELPPRLQRRPQQLGAPKPGPQLAEDGTTQLQVRISELDPATAIADADQLEVNQGGISRRMSIQQMKATTQPDLTPFLTGLLPGDGIQVLGGAPVPTVQLDDVGAPGTFGDATNVPQITTDPHGRVVSVTLVPIALPDLSPYAPIASPTFTGDPKAPTAAPGDADTSIATTAFVQSAINSRGFAPINDPAFTGNPTAPTPAPGDADTSIATTAFVEARVQSITPVDTSHLAPKDSPIFTGDPRAPTPALIDADTSIATCEFVKGQGYAPLASPAFSGNPTAPTPAEGDNDTSVATTAFVAAAIASGASISVGVAPPASPKPNQLWWYADAVSGGGQMYIFYNDGNSSQWVPASPAMSATSPGGDFAAVNSAPLGLGASIPAVAMLNVIQSGNSGAYYNTANGRFTPPAGRYFLFGTMSAASGGGACGFQILFRKNGVNLGGYSWGTAGAANWNEGATNALLVDASGTDYFELILLSGIAAQVTSCQFSAFPISGVKGPPGDVGAPVANFNVRATAGDTINGPAAVNVFRPLVGPVEDFDPDNVWDNANGIFIAPSTGRYEFFCKGYALQNPMAQTSLVIQHLSAVGAQIRAYGDAGGADPNTYGANRSIFAQFQMSAGDRVIFLWATVSGTTSVSPSGVLGGITMQLTYAGGRKVV